MKPDFALEFSDKSVALLHRTARGWLNIGEAAFDAPDLDGALEYLRKTALELAPGGFSTKLVIPNAQVLYAEVPLPPGGEAEIRTAITAVLVARTPYGADEIVFDWSDAQGVAKVAAVARETLAEAEEFANLHRLNPASFVAIPPDAAFEGEPWFGSPAGLRLPEGESVERDDSRITRVGEGSRPPRAKATARDSAEKGGTAGGSAAGGNAAGGNAAGGKGAPAGESRGAAGPASDSAPERGAGTSPVPAPSAGAEPPRSNAPARPSPPQSAPPRVGEAAAHGTGAPAAPKAPPTVTSGPAPAGELGSGQGDSGQGDSGEPDRGAPFAHVADHVTESRSAADGLTRATNGHAAGPPAEEGPRVTEPPPTRATAAPAPTAPSPTPARMASAPVASLSAAPMPAPIPVGVTDSLPPAPAPAILAARATRWGEAPPGPAMPRGAEGTPAAIPPRADGQDMPAAGQVRKPRPPERGSPGSARTTETSPAATAAPMTAPGQATAPGPGLAQTPAMTGTGGTGAAGTGTGGTGLQVPAPPARPAARPESAEPRPRARVKVTPRVGQAGTAQRPPTAAGEAARSLAQGPFASRQGQRGKPRYLGLILTAILLLCLALVAAWSSFYLASESPVAPEPVAVAGVEDAATPAVGEGIAVPAAQANAGEGADDTVALEPEASTGGQTAASSDGGPPADGATSSAPPVVVEGTPGQVQPATTVDASLIASTDAAPETFDRSELPQPASAAEPAPDAPMPPPPEGLVYQFDADGLIVPVPEGIPSPDGYMIRAGEPSKIPPPRSAEAEAAASAAAAAAATDTEAAPALAEVFGTGLDNGDSPAIEGPLPTAMDDSAALPATGAAAAPEAGEVAAAGASTDGGEATAAALSVPALSVPVPDTDSGATEAAEVTASAAPLEVDPGLASARPRPRPETPAETPAVAPATADDDASVTINEARDFAAVHPAPRSGNIAASEAGTGDAREQTAAASLAAGVAGAAPAPAAPEGAEGVAAGAPSAVNPAAVNPALVTVALRPAARPAGLSRAVDAAVNAALREAQPAPGAAQPSPEESAEIDEPEIAVASAPSIPTRANVAKEATVGKALALSKTSLIGVYGTPTNRHALVRSGNGKITKVKVGDRIEGGVIQAITPSEVRYQRGQKLYALAMPAG